ncbi:MAG: threonine/serine exporter family protein, partial [Candidatus Ornithospirochaeta sp.]
MSPMIVASAFLGTIAFSILYDVPYKFLLSCGVIGAVGWIVYAFLLPYIGNTTSIFLATVSISLISRFTAVRKKAP